MARAVTSALAQELVEGHLTWFPTLALGYFPVQAGTTPYDERYFERVAKNADTAIGRALMAARSDFVAKYHRGELIDIGIGSGAFIERHAAQGFKTCGYDVNPVGIEWLEVRDLFVDPYAGPIDAASMWDVLEHIADFRPLLDNVKEWLFVSVPIFESASHILRSRHFRKDEHHWYFSRRGLTNLMEHFSFRLVEYSDFESKIGREDIESFVFRRF